jgi:hypothetical protein
MVKAGERSVARGMGHEKVRGFGHTHTSVSNEIGKTNNQNAAAHIISSIDCILIRRPRPRPRAF